MKQIDLVIRLSEEVYDEILDGIENAEIAGVGLSDLSIALKNGTPLPKGIIATDRAIRIVRKYLGYSDEKPYDTVDAIIEDIMDEADKELDDADVVIEEDKKGTEVSAVKTNRQKFQEYLRKEFDRKMHWLETVSDEELVEWAGRNNARIELLVGRELCGFKLSETNAISVGTREDMLAWLKESEKAQKHCTKEIEEER